MFSPSRQWIWLAVILLLGLGLRLRAIHWGLPTRGPFFFGSSFRPDEIELFEALKELSWKRKQFHPTNLTFLLKGTLQVYVVGAALAVASPWLTITKDREVYKKDPDKLGNIYLVGRLVSVAQSLAAVAALFWLGTLMVNWRVGAGAAALLAVSPVHVVNGHYISPDSAFTLYLILLMIACYHIFGPAAAGLTWPPDSVMDCSWPTNTTRRPPASASSQRIFCPRLRAKGSARSWNWRAWPQSFSSRQPGGDIRDPRPVEGAAVELSHQRRPSSVHV